MIIHEPKEYSGVIGNRLKDLVQSDVGEVFDTVDSLVVLGYTGFGKTKIGISACNKAQGKIGVIVPTEFLQKEWQEKLKNHDADVHIINSYTMKADMDTVYDTFIIDECHHVLNKGNIFFKTVLPKTKARKTLLLSATLTSKHKIYLGELGIRNYYVISRYWGFKKGLVPSFMLYNIPVTLKIDELNEYLKVQDIIHQCSTVLIQARLTNPYKKYSSYEINRAVRDLNWRNSNQVTGYLAKWRKALNTRKEILYNAKEKLEVTAFILNEIIKDEQCFVFAMSKSFIDKLATLDARSVTYHSGNTAKQNKEAKNLFISNTRPHILSVQGLKEGVDVAGCHIGIRCSYTSTEIDTAQTVGRVTRYDEEFGEQEAVMIFLYVANFYARGKLVESQEEKWLKENQKSEHFVKWLESARQLPLMS